MKLKFHASPKANASTKMGVTIHFEGQLKCEAAYQDLIGMASSFAKKENWPTELIESAEVTLLRVRGEQDWDYTGPVKGIALYIHEDCDPVRLEFDRDLYIQEFTKTQFAGVECHLKVVDLLRAIQPFFHELKVEDEGEFWETKDRSILAAHVDWARRAIEDELRKNPSAQMKVKTPEGKIMDLIT
jgi:hypothetical protein